MPRNFGFVVVAHLPMITFLVAMVSLLSFRLRSRASLELEVIALRDQLSVLKRQRLGRAKLFSARRTCVASYFSGPLPIVSSSGLKSRQSQSSTNLMRERYEIVSRDSGER
jgi:hypothetical protein